MSVSERPAAAAEATPAYLRSSEDVIHELNTDVASGLSRQEAATRLATHGPNQITAEKPPSTIAIALAQLRDPMNIMLVAVAVVSLIIGQVSTALLVAVLVLLNVALGTRQELKARASVDALAKLQVPQTRVVRDSSVALVPAVDVVPGDVVQVEAGDIVPADGRIVASATLETQEAALTGESAPVSKDTAVLAGPEVAVGDRPTCSSKTPRSPGEPEPWWSPRPGCRPRWVRSRPCSLRSSEPVPRCRKSLTH